MKKYLLFLLVFMMAATVSAAGKLYLNLNGTVLQIDMADEDAATSLSERILDGRKEFSSYDTGGIIMCMDELEPLPQNPKQMNRIEAGTVLLDKNNRLLIFYHDSNWFANATLIGKISNKQKLSRAASSGQSRTLVLSSEKKPGKSNQRGKNYRR